MKIQKNEFIKALEMVRSGLASKEMIEQSTSFCFKDNKVITYNDEISVQCPINLEITGVINATELYQFVQKVKTEEIIIEEQENEILLKAGRSKAGFKLVHEINLPYEEIGKIAKFHSLPSDFITALKIIQNSCGKDLSSAVITNVHIKENIVEGTDNYQAGQYFLTENFPIEECLIPAQLVPVIERFEALKIAKGEGWVHFKNKFNAILSIRTFNEKYPDISPIFNMKGKQIELPVRLLESIEKAEIFSKREHTFDESIMLEIEGNKLKIKSESDSAWFEERQKIEYKGEDLKLNITPSLLKHILEKTTTTNLSNNKLFFKTKDFQFVIMLRN